MASDSETVTISKEKYESLLQDSYVLSALQQGGVDNWDWYGESISNWNEENGGLIE